MSQTPPGQPHGLNDITQEWKFFPLPEVTPPDYSAYHGQTIKNFDIQKLIEKIIH